MVRYVQMAFSNGTVSYGDVVRIRGFSTDLCCIGTAEIRGIHWYVFGVDDGEGALPLPECGEGLGVGRYGNEPLRAAMLRLTYPDNLAPLSPLEEE